MNWPTDNAGIVLMLLQHEGGFVNLNNDRGGPTSMGITLDQLASFRKCPVSVQDLKNLTVQEATALYTAKFIVGPNFDQIVDVRLRAALVDFGVLFGPLRAIQALQTIVNTTPDGFLGPKTLAAVNALTDVRAAINQLSVARVVRHADRVIADNSQLVFLKGWISRALSFIE